MDAKACRSCRAPVIWTRTDAGKRMPVDAAPVIVRRGFRLTETTDAELRSHVRASFTASPEAGELLYTSHFATCPNARQHRR